MHAIYQTKGFRSMAKKTSLNDLSISMLLLPIIGDFKVGRQQPVRSAYTDRASSESIDMKVVVFTTRSSPATHYFLCTWVLSVQLHIGRVGKAVILDVSNLGTNHVAYCSLAFVIHYSRQRFKEGLW